MKVSPKLRFVALFCFLHPGYADFSPFHRFGPKLEELVSERRSEIAQQREHWREKALQIRSAHPLFFAELDEALEAGELRCLEGGNGSTYLLSDGAQNPRFILKPSDEAIYCLNNPHPQYASPFHDRAFRVHPHIPLYRSCQTEALAYLVASLIADLAGYEYEGTLVPETYLSLVDHPLFGCEKLCSVQRFVPHSGKLLDLIRGLKNQTVAKEQIDTVSCELLMLFVWYIYDTDAHVRNFLIRDEPIALIKIDNDLSFPQENEKLLNLLVFLPEARRPLSRRAREVIENFPVEQVVEQMRFFELEEAIDAFLERCALLKKLATYPALSKAQIDEKLRLFSTPKSDSQVPSAETRVKPPE